MFRNVNQSLIFVLINYLPYDIQRYIINFNGTVSQSLASLAEKIGFNHIQALYHIDDDSLVLGVVGDQSLPTTAGVACACKDECICATVMS